MTRWLVTGAGGMLGQDLLARLRGEAEEVIGLARRDLDVTDPAAVRTATFDLRPQIVVNCAAWTAVDAAEASELDAFAVNGTGPANLAAACADGGARLVQVSTDYVFDGNAREPYAEDAVSAPRTAYGRTKLAGEQAVFERLPGRGYVLRTAWLYGAHGPNFVRTMIRLERQQREVSVVDDQYGQPTWTAEVARLIVDLMRADVPPGIYHATSSGQATWCMLAREVFQLIGADPARVLAVPSSAVRRAAERPTYSVLGHDGLRRAGLPPIDGWPAVLRRAMPALVAADRDDAPLSAEAAAAPRISPD
ncbi:MAG: dTDP-4-dehydrorhamnose reductase [Streptosporangiaceae bacterium]